MQDVVIVTLKPNISVTRFTSAGWRTAGIESSAVNDVIVRLLRSNWRLTSGTDSTLYFTRETTLPESTAKPPQPARANPVIPLPEATNNRFNEPLRSGETVRYEREHIPYDKAVVEPVYVRPSPQMSDGRSQPQSVDIDEWLK